MKTRTGEKGWRRFLEGERARPKRLLIPVIPSQSRTDVDKHILAMLAVHPQTWRTMVEGQDAGDISRSLGRLELLGIIIRDRDLWHFVAPRRSVRMTKQTAYRMRQAQAGRCPHCGKPSAPYYECAERRMKKRQLTVLRELRRAGEIVRSGAPGKVATWGILEQTSL